MGADNFCAVILAVEREQVPGIPAPKCILPMANVPLMWYPLHSLQLAGFTECLVVVEERYFKDIRHAMQKCPELSLSINYVSVTSPKDGLGSAEALKLAQDHINNDFLVVDCTFLSDFPLTKVLDIHRVKEATVTCLLSAAGINSAAPGPKVNVKKDYQLNIIHEETGRFLFTGDRKEYGDNVPIDRQIFTRFLNVRLDSKLVDCSVYVFQRGVIELLNEIKGLRSIRYDLIPFIFEAQLLEDLGSLPKEFLKSLERSDERNAALSLSRSALAHQLLESSNPVTCFAYQLKNNEASVLAYCHHIGNYFEANKMILKNLSKFYAESGSGGSVAGSAQVGNDCLVGQSTTIGDKSQIKRSVIGKHCSIAANCKVVNSLLMDNVTLHDGCIVMNSIVCHGAALNAKVEVKDCIVAAGVSLPPSSELSTISPPLPSMTSTPMQHFQKPIPPSLWKTIRSDRFMTLVKYISFFVLLIPLLCLFVFFCVKLWLHAMCMVIMNR